MFGQAIDGQHALPVADPIRVAIVDDSTVARAMIGWMVEQAGMRVVATAANGTDAISALGSTETDVVVLDLEMPRMDGLSALPQILRATNAPVLVVSSLTTHGARSTIEALRLGAADTLAKPNIAVSGTGTRVFGDLLIDKIRTLGRSRAQLPAADMLRERYEPETIAFEFAGELQAIAIAASTGGPSAMFQLFSGLAALPDIPILVTQHLPEPFVPVLAEHLSRYARRPAMVVMNGQSLLPGTIHLAPGTAHLGLDCRHGSIFVRLEDGPAPSGCRPSADPMFEAVARHYGNGALAVVLSGMGRDGAEGARKIREAGGAVIAQDMQSSVVWGMPGVVCKQGIANVSRPPAAIAALINSIGIATA